MSGAHAPLMKALKSTSSVEVCQREQNEAVHQAALAAGCPQTVANLLSRRVDDPALVAKLIKPELGHLTAPHLLADSDKAVMRLIQAIDTKQTIGILSDYDVDGITGHAVIRQSLIEWFGVDDAHVIPLIGHRLHDGYGVSAGLVNRILELEQKPNLIITVDCGSSDDIQIARLQKHGIDVIVTDHHTVPSSDQAQTPFALLNPRRIDCDYPDDTIAGCMVAWLFMSATRNALNEKTDGDIPKLGGLLDLVALGTVADAVTLGGLSNRAVVNAGLKTLNSSRRPAWMALKRASGKQQFDARDMGFYLGPRINARGRVADPTEALHFLLATTEGNAKRHLSVLEQDNQTRRDIEKTMTITAIKQVGPRAEQTASLLCAFDESFHPGVQGIVASRLVDKYGKPALVLSPSGDSQVVGSARSVDGFNIRDCLSAVAKAQPDAVIKFGGHPMAAGITIEKTLLNDFLTSLSEVSLTMLNDFDLRPRFWTDGVLNVEHMHADTIALHNQLEPFGRGFEPPLYENEFIVEDTRTVGADRSHLSLTLKVPDHKKGLRAIWFKADTHFMQQVAQGQRIHACFRLQLDDYRGNNQIQLQIEHAQFL